MPAFPTPTGTSFRTAMYDRFSHVTGGRLRRQLADLPFPCGGAGMTRDEAFDVIYPWGRPTTVTKSEADRFIDWSVALGMLKLDVPTSVEDRAIDALVSIRIGRESAPSIIYALNRAGLKIVE